MPTAARMMAIVRARHAASDRSAGPPTGRSVVAPFSMVRCRTKRRREQRRILIGPTWARRRQSRGSQIERLPLLLHPDLGALRTFPLPLLVVDVALDLLHRDPALSTRHLYSQHRTEVVFRNQSLPERLTKTAASSGTGCCGYGKSRSSLQPSSRFHRPTRKPERGSTKTRQFSAQSTNVADNRQRDR